jgi:hypothetical protein
MLPGVHTLLHHRLEGLGADQCGFMCGHNNNCPEAADLLMDPPIQAGTQEVGHPPIFRGSNSTFPTL